MLVCHLANQQINTARITSTAINGIIRTILQVLLFGVGVGGLVAYFFSRKISLIRADQIAKEILVDMPDPNNLPGTTANQRTIDEDESK